MSGGPVRAQGAAFDEQGGPADVLLGLLCVSGQVARAARAEAAALPPGDGAITPPAEDTFLDVALGLICFAERLSRFAELHAGAAPEGPEDPADAAPARLRDLLR